jgi:hypothetical protein
MSEYKNYGIMLAIIAVLGVFAYKYVSRPVIIEKVILETIIDTVYVAQDPVVITKYIQLDSIVFDTIYFETNDTVYITDKYQDSIIYRVVELKPSMIPIINTTQTVFNEGVLLESYNRLRVYGGVTFDNRGLEYSAPTLLIGNNKFQIGISKTLTNEEFRITTALRLGKD